MQGTVTLTSHYAVFFPRHNVHGKLVAKAIDSELVTTALSTRLMIESFRSWSSPSGPDERHINESRAKSTSYPLATWTDFPALAHRRASS